MLNFAGLIALMRNMNLALEFTAVYVDGLCRVTTHYGKSWNLWRNF